MEKYPGYNVDPRVRKVVDRCVSMGMTDFHKPYSNKNDLFKFSTLERDLCIPSKMKLTGKEERKRLIKGAKPGTLVMPAVIRLKARPAAK